MDREHTIAGKVVTFRQKFPAGENHDLPQMWVKANGADATFEDKVLFLQRFVEAWEFDGSPSDMAAWAALDTWREFVPLWRIPNTYVADQLSDAKN